MKRSATAARTTLRVLVNTVLTVVLLGSAAFVLPGFLGYQRYVITSGSMTGSYDRGSLVFDRVVPTSSLTAGDVITFRPPGRDGLVTHRIAAVRTVRGERLFTTRGDANEAADVWSPMTLAAARQARVVFHLPYVGFALAALSERRVRMLVIGLPALLIALATLGRLWREAAEDPAVEAPA
jgi:signal peptidase I